jgi:ABC-type phosphate transport system substrate-binding protein
MSRTLNAPRWGMSAALAGALALTVVVLAAFGLTAKANAAFSLGKCAGTSITGEGGSFARDAHGQFNFSLSKIYCPSSSLTVTYKPEGSGAGVTAMTKRELEPRFGHTDDPPTTEQVAQMNAGTTEPGKDANPNDNAKVHVVPAAVGSVVVTVNFPNGCNPEDITDDSFRTVSQAELTGDATKKSLLRVRFPKATFEKIWAQGVAGTSPVPLMKWSDLPGLSGKAPCEVPIVRVVRFDQSGTTFTLKDYLNTIKPDREWKTKYATTTAKILTREWPGATFGPRDDCGDKDGVAEPTDPEGPGAPGLAGDTDQLTSNCAKGNGELLKKLKDTDGSIGYSDLATARNNNPTFAVNSASGATPDLFWTQVQNGSNQFTEPTDDPKGYLTTTGIGAGPHKGANCLNATFTNAPASTLGDWSQTSGVNSAAGYGICTITYGLVFDDNAAAWGNTSTEEAKARTVKDYWESALTDASQALLFPADYAQLPPSLLAISRAGVKQIDWNKAGSGGGGGGGTGGTGGGSGSSNPAPLPIKPSNLFTVPRKSISSKTGGATVSVKLPGPGQLEMLGTAKAGKKQIKVGRTVLNASKAGTFSLQLKPSGAAKQLLRKKGSLRVSLVFTFTPTGGEESTTTSSITLKLKQKGNSG